MGSLNNQANDYGCPFLVIIIANKKVQIMGFSSILIVFLLCCFSIGIEGFSEDHLSKCVTKCTTNSCVPDSSLTRGCNQMFSCAQACNIRDLGISRGECQHLCQRNGQSGCSPSVEGHTFDLCGECNRHDAGTCSTWPTQAECEIGCFYYAE